MPDKPEPYRLVSLPDGFRKYPAGADDNDGEINVDLGVWENGNGGERFHLTIVVREMPTLLRAIKASNGFARYLYRCMHVFRVGNS